MQRDYGWKRFWFRREGSRHLEAGGFLPDPETPFSRHLNPDVHSFEEIVETACLALLGNPGTGKSRTLEAEFNRRQSGDTAPMAIDLREYSAEDRLYRELFESDRVHTWIASNETLEIVLDSLDECRIYIPTVAALLAKGFKRCPTDRLKLRIACRTAEWPQLLDQELPRIWGESRFAAYEVAPLRRLDVVKAAAINQLDADAFFAEVYRHEITSLCTAPLTLELLFGAFHEAGQFPSTRGELYEKGCLLLARESSPSRLSSGAVGSLSKHERLALAERIAAATIFSRRSAIFIGDDETKASFGDVTLSEITEGEEIAQDRSVASTNPHIRETLQTALFTGRGPDRLGWSHWTYAEYLSARYLTTRSFTTEQLRDLLFHPESGERKKVIPQLYETAAWVASMKPEILADIIAGDPAVLLRSTVASTDDETRYTLVASLLHLLDSGELIDDAEFSRRYEVLCHARLADQLRPFIRDSSKDIVVRRVAMDIAEVCKVEELLPDLLEVALNKLEDHQVRDQASYSIAHSGDPESRRALEQLLTCDRIEDPDDQLRGNTLYALFGLIPLADLLSHVAPPRQENSVGEYRLFLSKLGSKLAPAEIPDALSWFASDSVANLTSRTAGNLLESIPEAAWKNLGDSKILDAYAMAVAAILGRTSSAPELVKDYSGEAGKRRSLLAKLVEKGFCQDGSLLWRLRNANLLLKEDFEWALSQYTVSLGSAHEEPWAEVAGMLFEPYDPTHLEVAYLACRATAGTPSLRRIRNCFQAVDIDSEYAAHEREFLARNSRYPRPRATPLDPPLESWISHGLDDFEAGDLTAWWRLNLDLTIDTTTSSYGDELPSDLTILPGWSVVDACLASRCIAAAEVYLSDADPHAQVWIGRNILHRPAAAGYRALRLLLKLNPELLAKLPRAIWSKWVPIILGYPENETRESLEARQRLVAFAYRNAPEEAIETIKTLVVQHDQEDLSLLFLRYFKGAWDERLAAALIDYAREHPNNLRPRSFSDLLSASLPHATSVGMELAFEVVERMNDGEEAREKGIAAASALLEVLPELAWPRLWPLIKRDPSLGKSIFIHSYRPMGASADLGSRLAEDAVADLCIWLYEQFPNASHTPHPRSHDAEEGALGSFGEALLSALGKRGTAAAVRASKRVAERFPDRLLLRFFALDADRARLSVTWEGVAPSVVLKMAKGQEARLVESEGQLLKIVIESMQRLERKLQGTPPAVRDLWNHQPRRPKEEAHLSNYLVRHLRDDLAARAVVANREVEIRPGEKTDIHVTAFRLDRQKNADTVSVILEAKGCWNKRLKVDMKEQLKERYLRDNPTRHGLYVVGWFLSECWEKGDYRYSDTPKFSFEDAKRHFAERAAQLSENETCLLRAFVLNCRWR